MNTRDDYNYVKTKKNVFAILMTYMETKLNLRQPSQLKKTN